MKTKIVLSTILLFATLLAACRAPLTTVSSFDITTETILPAQATTPTPTPTRTPTPTPTPPPKLTREQMQPTQEERAKMSKALEDSYARSGKPPDTSTHYVISGPTTKGMTIPIAGKQIKLPDDAYVEHYVIVGTASPGKVPPPTPYFVIARSNSRVIVPTGSGKIYSETIAPGEEGAFNFLKEALK